MSPGFNWNYNDIATRSILFWINSQLLTAGIDDVSFLTQTTSAIGKMEYVFICQEPIVGEVYTLELKTKF
jgi:hypothetical protein